MRLKQRKKEDIQIYCVCGEINVDSVGELKKEFNRLMSSGVRKVILNFKDLDYIDSAGLAFLIQFSQDLKNMQGVVFLSDLSPKVRSLFAITKLENAFPIFESEGEAFKSFYGY